MLYSYNWLKDYLDEEELKKQKWTAEKIGERVSLTNWECDGVEKIRFSWPGVVIGKVLKVDKHPNADKLSVAMVDVKKEKLQIVCGANNLAKGMLVPVALVGTKLKEGFEIKEIEIRGVKSTGMICAAEELGLEEKSSGILDLGKDLPIGVELDKALTFDDEALEFTILPNRPDGMAMIGMAKEIGLATGVKYFEPKFKFKENSAKKIDNMLEVNIKDPENCHRYSARVIDNVKIKESPLWLKRRLIVAGMRPINAVVDITNYVMLEYGQPMHAFDYDLLIGHKIFVRKAKKGERIVTLDGQKKILSDHDLIIADEKRPLALAGIIGGEDSGVLNKTKTIVLESANFARQVINNTSHEQGVATDSSIRFGKGLPASWTIKALERATYLIVKICGGEVVRGMIDVRSKRLLKNEIELEYEYLNSFLGVDVPKTDVKRILKDLGFEIGKFGDESLSVTVPDDRIDVEGAEDLIEEVGRIYGYDKVLETTFSMAVDLPRPEKKRQYRNKIINYFFNKGWSEVYSYSFVTGKNVVDWGFELENSFELLNPLDQDLKYLRQSLVAGLVEKYRKWSKYDEVVQIFEWGKVYSKLDKDKERTKIGLVWGEDKNAKDLFLAVKGLVEGILALGGRKIEQFELKRAEQIDEQIEYLHPVNSLVIVDEHGRILGSFGLLHPRICGNEKLKKNLVYGEFDLNNLVENFDEMYRYQESSKFPVSKFDAAFLVDWEVMARDLIKEAEAVDKDLLKKVEVFDEFEIDGSKFNVESLKGNTGRKKSVALRFYWQAEDRTLSDEEVNGLMEKIYSVLKDKFGALLRDR